MLAVYREEIESLARLAPALLAEHPPLVALRAWLDRVAGYGQLKFGVAEVIHAAAGGEEEAYALVVGAIRELLDACTTAGVLRPDVDPDDFLLLISFLWRIDPRTGGVRRATRMLDLLLEGLLPRP